MGGPTNNLVYPTRVEVDLGWGCGWAATIDHGHDSMIDHHFENMLSNKNEFRSWEMDHWSWVKGMSVGHGCGSWVMGYRAWAWGLGTWSNWSSRFTIHLYFIYYQNQPPNNMCHYMSWIKTRLCVWPMTHDPWVIYYDPLTTTNNSWLMTHDLKSMLLESWFTVYSDPYFKNDGQSMSPWPMSQFPTSMTH